MVTVVRSLTDDEIETIARRALDMAAQVQPNKTDQQKMAMVLGSSQLNHYLTNPNKDTLGEVAYLMLDQDQKYTGQDAVRRYNSSGLSLFYGGSWNRFSSLADLMVVLRDQGRYAAVTAIVLMILNVLGGLVEASLGPGALVIEPHRLAHSIGHNPKLMSVCLLAALVAFLYSTAAGLKAAQTGVLVALQPYIRFGLLWKTIVALVTATFTLVGWVINP